MTTRFEPKVEPINRRWLAKQAPGLSYAERSDAFRRTLPNAQEFVILLRGQDFVPIRHLIAGAITENNNPSNVYSGIDGHSLRSFGTMTDSVHAKFDDQDGSLFASSIDHIAKRVLVPPDLDRDPFILFHLNKTQQPTILAYDTSKLQQITETRWVPGPDETLSSAVSGVYHLSSKKNS